nr:putative transporter ArsB [Tanacetum cinerariifolium]
MSDFMEPYAPIDHISDIAILAVVIVVLSNPASNVPTLLLLGARVVVAAATISPEKEKKAWLILAWVSTLAVNLSLLGSAANSIVCEQACRSQNYGYKSHLVVSSQVWCSFNNYSCSNRFDTYKSIKKHTPCDSI